MDKQKMDFEYDVSDEVWDVYKKVYNKEKWSFWRKVDLQHPTYKKNRRYAYIDTTTNDYIEFNEHKTFAMSRELILIFIRMVMVRRNIIYISNI